MSEPSQANQTSERPDKYGLRSYIRRKPRSLIPHVIPKGTRPLFVRGLSWVLPWTIADYPGIQKGTVDLLGGKVGLETVRSWRKGYRGFPAWAALAIAEAIEVRCRSGYALIEELRAYAAVQALKPKSGPGFRKVDPVTGMDGRPKIGRRRAKEV